MKQKSFDTSIKPHVIMGKNNGAGAAAVWNLVVSIKPHVIMGKNNECLPLREASAMSGQLSPM